MNKSFLLLLYKLVALLLYHTTTAFSFKVLVKLLCISLLLMMCDGSAATRMKEGTQLKIQPAPRPGWFSGSPYHKSNEVIFNNLGVVIQGHGDSIESAGNSISAAGDIVNIAAAGHDIAAAGDSMS